MTSPPPRRSVAPHLTDSMRCSAEAATISSVHRVGAGRADQLLLLLGSHRFTAEGGRTSALMLRRW